MASSDSSEETESLPAGVERTASSATEETTDEELPVLEEKPECSVSEDSKIQEESPPSQENTTAGDIHRSASSSLLEFSSRPSVRQSAGSIPRSASSSSLEFSSQPFVRQSMLVKRKEAMLQQARR